MSVSFSDVVEGKTHTHTQDPASMFRAPTRPPLADSLLRKKKKPVPLLRGCRYRVGRVRRRQTVVGGRDVVVLSGKGCSGANYRGRDATRSKQNDKLVNTMLMFLPGLSAARLSARLFVCIWLAHVDHGPWQSSSALCGCWLSLAPKHSSREVLGHPRPAAVA